MPTGTAALSDVVATSDALGLDPFSSAFSNAFGAGAASALNDAAVSSDAFTGVFSAATITLGDSAVTGGTFAGVLSAAATTSNPAVSSDAATGVFSATPAPGDSAVTSDALAVTARIVTITDFISVNDVPFPGLAGAAAAAISDAGVSSDIYFSPLTVIFGDTAVSSDGNLAYGGASGTIGAFVIGVSPIGSATGLAASALADSVFTSDVYKVTVSSALLADSVVSSDVIKVTASSLTLTDTVVSLDQVGPPGLSNDGGVLVLTQTAGYPVTAAGAPGSFWSNGGVVSVVPGGPGPDPAAPPVILGNITPAALLALGGVNLPVSPPLNNNQLWNSGGEVWVASVLWPTDIVQTGENLTGVLSGQSAAFTDSDGSSDAFTATAASAPGLGDYVSGSDLLTPAFSVVFSSPLSDGTTTADSLPAIGASFPLLADTGSTGDQATGGAGVWSAALADTVVSTDAPSGILGAVSLADTTATSDSATVTQYTGAFPVSDTAVTGDSYSLGGAVNQGFTLADTVITSDAVLSPASSGFVADTAVTADTLGINWHGQSVLNDTVASTDTRTVTVGTVFVTLNDTAVTADSLPSAGMAVTASLGDTAVCSDGTPFSASLILFDAVIGTDTFVLTATQLAVADTTVSGDALTASAAAASVTLSDSAVSSDFLPAANFGLSLPDAAVSGDSLVSGAAPAGTLSDSAASSDIPFIAAVSQLVSDLAVSGDTLTSTTATGSVPLSDTVATGDTLPEQANAPVSTADTATSSETLAGLKGFLIPALADSAISGDGVTLTGYGYWSVLQDGAASGESWSRSGITYPPSVIATVIPTGGVVLLQFPSAFVGTPNASAMTISRSIAGSGVWTPIYQGPPIGAFIDVGDGLPAPLDPGIGYLWQIANSGGEVTAGPLMPAPSFLNAPDQLTQILIRALQGALNSMPLPAGVQRPLVTIKMPVNGWMAMPFVVVNLDLIQQKYLAIGEDMVNPTPDNNWTLFATANRCWRVTVMSQDPEERDFFRDSLLAVFRVLKATAFSPIGLDVTHSFHAVSYSSAHEWQAVTPGFYAADLLFEIDGVFPAAVMTDYPVILQIAASPVWLLDTFSETLTG